MYVRYLLLIFTLYLTIQMSNTNSISVYNKLLLTTYIRTKCQNINIYGIILYQHFFITFKIKRVVMFMKTYEYILYLMKFALQHLYDTRIHALNTL